jgi:integrase
MGSRYSMTLKRDAKSGSFKDRIRLPEDVRREYQALYGPAWEEKFRGRAGTPLDKARAEHAAWAAKIKGRIAALRDKRVGNSVDLTQRQADALAGDWYREFTSKHSDNPGSPDGYDIVRYDLWRTAVEAGDPETDEADFDDPEVLSEVATLARADQFLTDRGMALSQAGRTRFLASLVREFLAATAILERRARGDWGPDKHAETLLPSQPLGSPNGASRPAGSKARLSAMQLFEAWRVDRQPAASTVARWRGVFTTLNAMREPIQDAEVAQQWLDSLKTEDRSASTVRGFWLRAARTVYAWAKRKRLIAVNPFEDCVVEVPRKAETRETGKAFTDAEVSTILQAALQIEARTVWDAARRWVPWLCAYTGARVGELTQLRAKDVDLERKAILISPDAGSVKNHKARVVPLHAHLVEMGFLDYVNRVRAEQGQDAPLFYHKPTQPPLTTNHQTPAVRMRGRLGVWVRSLGINDPEIRPNHAWRHTFKTRAARAKIEQGIRDKIAGHAPRSTAEGYEHVTFEDMAEALKQFPRYAVAAHPPNGRRKAV